MATDASEREHTDDQDAEAETVKKAKRDVPPSDPTEALELVKFFRGIGDAAARDALIALAKALSTKTGPTK